jgi:hypothetical protein
LRPSFTITITEPLSPVKYDILDTLNEMGVEFNVTRERIRQIEAKALAGELLVRGYNTLESVGFILA